ncbi:heavy-metal-associated domain-containing protein [Patescibacteria group bacterium]|nr:heavy-metal-associated domain-containing protein [Patescibacteria group bacterium]
MQKVDFNIEGMHCGACATGIQMLVTQMDGVKSAFVDYEGKKGTIEFDPAKVTKEQIIQNINTIGYTAT